MTLSVEMLNAGLPTAPHELQDEVELWARKAGRHARLHFIPVGGWFCRVTLRLDDPRMEAYQQGLVPDPPGEDIWFHEPDPSGRPGDFKALDILQMGTSGVKAFLEKGDTWSGRGDHRSIVEAQQAASEANRIAKDKHRAFAKEENRHEQRDKRRSRLGIPFLRVLKNIGK